MGWTSKQVKIKTTGRCRNHRPSLYLLIQWYSKGESPEKTPDKREDRTMWGLFLVKLKVIMIKWNE